MERDNIIKALHARNLTITFPEIRREAEDLGNWPIIEEVETLWNTYSQMLIFMIRGYSDPKCEEIRNGICEKLINITYNLAQVRRVKENPVSLYAISYKHKKSVQSFEYIISSLESKCVAIKEVGSDVFIPNDEKEAKLDELYADKDSLLLRLFNYVWTSTIWSDVDIEQANRILLSEKLTTNDKSVFLSSVTLSLLEVPDASKLLLLLDSYIIGNNIISQRALIGFVIGYNKHHALYDATKELNERLDIYKDDTEFLNDLCATMMQLQMTATTDAANNKIASSILPILMQQHNNIKSNGADYSQLIKNGENPEWANDKANKAMGEISSMFQNGVDINFSQFKNHKNESFFNRVSHWFYLFSFETLTRIDKKCFTSPNTDGVLKTLLTTEQFCDSDKYSMCYIFSNMRAFEGMINDAISPDLKIQLNELHDLLEEKKQEPSKNAVRRAYIHDLYRFFMCNPYKKEFYNPFLSLQDTPLSPLSHEWTWRLFSSQKDGLSQYSDFLMRNGYYGEALKIYPIFVTNKYDENLAGEWQKIGFCQQKLGNLSKAAEAYSIANKIKPNSKWTLTHLASVSMSLQQWEMASHCYAQLMEIENDNTKFMNNMVEALLNMSRYDEAIHLLHKLDYLTEDPSVKLKLAYVLIVSNRIDEANTELLKIQSEQIDIQQQTDMLKGICLLTKKMLPEAYEICSNSTSSKSIDYLEGCIEALVEKKIIDQQTCTLFVDALRLQIQL